MGEFFRKALISYKHAHAMPKTGAVDQWMLDQVPVTYTTYTIRDEDLKLVGNLPGSHAEQAKLKWLPYTSLLEFVAERYHSAEYYIRKLNPGKNWEHLQPGETLKVPNVLPFEIEKFTEGKVPEIRRSLLARFLSIRTSTFSRSSTTISWSVSFRLRRDRRLCRRRWARGRFSA